MRKVKICYNCGKELGRKFRQFTTSRAVYYFCPTNGTPVEEDCLNRFLRWHLRNADEDYEKEDDIAKLRRALRKVPRRD